VALSILRRYGVGGNAGASVAQLKAQSKGGESTRDAGRSRGGDSGRREVSMFSDSEAEGYLRWAVLKALVLLRLRRDALDELVDAMREGGSVGQCIACIEAAIDRAEGV
jgi:hypothetical protein